MLKIRYQFVLSFVLGIAAAILLSNCSGTSPDTTASLPNPNAQSGTFGSVYNMIYSKGCIECHKPGGLATVDNNVQLDFSSQSNAYGTLLAGGVHGATSTGTCSAVSLVNTTTPAYSYILAEVVPGYSQANFGGVANCTPWAGHTAALTSAEQTSLLTGIQNGAQNN